MNGNLAVFMVTQERMGSPEIVVIYFASKHITFEKHCQSIALHHSDFFCLVTQRQRASRDKTKRLHRGPIPYALSRLLCRHERCLPTKRSAA